MNDETNNSSSAQRKHGFFSPSDLIELEKADEKEGAEVDEHHNIEVAPPRRNHHLLVIVASFIVIVIAVVLIIRIPKCSEKGAILTGDTAMPPDINRYDADAFTISTVIVRRFPMKYANNVSMIFEKAETSDEMSRLCPLVDTSAIQVGWLSNEVVTVALKYARNKDNSVLVRYSCTLTCPGGKQQQKQDTIELQKNGVLYITLLDYLPDDFTWSTGDYELYFCLDDAEAYRMAFQVIE